MEELLERFKEYLIKKKKPYVHNVVKDLGIEEYQVYGLVEIMKRQGYLFDIVEGQIVKIKPVKENDIYRIPSNLEKIKLLLISDTHLGNKYDRLDILRYLYAKAEDTGVNYVLHAGDLTEGLSGRPDQIYSVDFDLNGSIIKNFASEKPRENQNLEKMYLSGVFGGIPLYEIKQG